MQEHYREGIPDEVCLLELVWYTKEVIVPYVKCERCGQKGCQVEENRGQRVIPDRQKWCGCQKRKETEAACPEKGKAQQSGAWAEAPEGVYYGSSEQEKVSCVFKHLVQNLKAYNGVEI